MAEPRRGSGPLLPPSVSTVLTGGEICSTDGAEEKMDDRGMKLCEDKLLRPLFLFLQSPARKLFAPVF